MTNPFEAAFEKHGAKLVVEDKIERINGRPVVNLSYSSHKTIRHCPRRWQMAKQFHQPKYDNEDNHAATGGKAGHEYIQTLLAGGSEQDACMRFFETYDFEGEANASEYNRKYRTFEAQLYAAQELHRHIGLTPDDVAKVNVNGNLLPAIELKFKFVIDNPANANIYTYRGLIDLATYSPITNRHIARDFKFHRDNKVMGDDASHKYQYDEQLVPYGLVLQHTTGKPINRFNVAYHTAYVDIVDAYPVSYTFEKTEADVHGWFTNLSLTIAMIESYYNNPVWPRSISGCDMFGKPCKFFRHCHLEDHDELQEAILGRRKPKPDPPFGEWITIELEVA